MIERYLNGLEIKKDELTAIERDKLLSEGKEADRIMCCLDTGETLAPMIGCTLNEYYHSSEKMCELEEYIYHNFHSDGAGVSCTLRGMAEAMGAKVKYADYNIAQLEEPALPLKEAHNAKLVDVDKDGRLPIILKGVRLVKEKLGGKVPVSATVTGPFTIAAMAVGTEQLLIGTVKMPDKVRALMDIIVENNNRYIDRLLDIGVGIGFADPVSSTSLISVEQYKKFSLPYFQKNVDHIKKNGGGCGLHICGTSRKLWDYIKETGIGAFSLDNVEDVEEAKYILGGRMCIQGNVPPVEVMRFGTPYDVLRSAKECIRKGYDSPKGYVLTSGCQMPIKTPKENMQALMDAARIFGRYPIDEELLR
ncbi:MtaA/CmuA family methyltransferase [Dorea sp. 5-2]|nr:MtaA/CmuA family methyltransferase [Dorea sp. 5-2]